MFAAHPFLGRNSIAALKPFCSSSSLFAPYRPKHELPLTRRFASLFCFYLYRPTATWRPVYALAA